MHAVAVIFKSAEPVACFLLELIYHHVMQRDQTLTSFLYNLILIKFAKYVILLHG